MTTLLYGELPEADVAPGNRADAEESGAHPRLLPTIELRAITVEAVEPPPLPPQEQPDPAPNPWGEPRLLALPAMMMGLAAAAAGMGGLAMWGIALAWSQSLTTLTQLGLSVVGGYLVAVTVATILAVEPQRASA